MDNTKNFSSCDVVRTVEINGESLSYRMASGADIRMGLRPKKFLIDGLIAEGDIVLISGPSGGCKTTFTDTIGMLVASEGIPAIGLMCKPGPLPVADITCEDYQGIMRRYVAWNDEYNDGGDLDGFSAAEAIPKIDTEDGLQALIEMLRKKNLDFKLIILDHLQALMKGDENSAKDCNKFMNAVVALSRAFNNATVLVIHHTGKNGGKDTTAIQRMRGSSAIWGRATSVIEIEPVKENEDAPLKEIRTTLKKSKHGPIGRKLVFRPKIVEIAIPDPESKSEIIHEDVLILGPAEEFVPSVEPPAPSKAMVDLRQIYDVWRNASDEDVAYGEEKVHRITKHMYREYLRGLGMEESSINNNLRTDNKRPLGRLLKAGFVRLDGDWIVITEAGENALVGMIATSAPAD